MLKECANVRSVLSVVSDFEIRSVHGHQAWKIPGIDQKIISVADFKGGGGVLAIEEGAVPTISTAVRSSLRTRSVPSYHFSLPEKNQTLPEHRYIARLEEVGVL